MLAGTRIPAATRKQFACIQILDGCQCSPQADLGKLVAPFVVQVQPAARDDGRHKTADNIVAIQTPAFLECEVSHPHTAHDVVILLQRFALHLTANVA